MQVLVLLGLLSLALGKPVEGATRMLHFNHTFVFELFGLNMPYDAAATTKPEYKGLPVDISLITPRVDTTAMTTWYCWKMRATSLTGREIGHAELCWLEDPLSVVKLVVEDVGTLVFYFYTHGMLNQISPDLGFWGFQPTLLPDTQGSFLPHLSKGVFRKWTGYCYAHIVNRFEDAASLIDFPSAFFDCSYRKPEHQKRIKQRANY
eukprot:TRINITY_DN104_c0_g1_i2.p1 TRINITY_DN104_c0_g1~~TRINITY_DN104_c0_g1_i2.p1  ORF type:complete len:206 (-),score=22.74 TRINITY_DN104_c0_g1_i2:12-629(-)